jgi:hypothetical protein
LSSLLAVDLALRTGLACYDESGRLRWYRSRDFGDAAHLRRAIPALLDEPGDLTRLVIEGQGPLAAGWAEEAAIRDVSVQWIPPGEWRRLLLPDPTSRAAAKRDAPIVARRVIAWSGLRPPSSLDHDAAEAILIGVWGVMNAGWLREIPT